MAGGLGRSRYFALVGILLVMASGAAYVGDQRSWLPQAYQSVLGESADSVQAKGELRASRLELQDILPRASVNGAKRKTADSEEAATVQEFEQRRSQALIEYQRQHLAHIEAERRVRTPGRKMAKASAPLARESKDADPHMADGRPQTRNPENEGDTVAARAQHCPSVCWWRAKPPKSEDDSARRRPSFEFLASRVLHPW